MSSATDFLVSLLSKRRQRLLSLYFPNDDGPQAGLLINQLHAEESLSQDFCYTVTALSDDPHIPLTDVQGRMVCVALQREDGTKRYFNGYCFEFALISVENSLASYQMILRPWLAQFSLRHNHRLFHNQNIQAQSKEIFLESGLSSHVFRIRDSDPARTFSCQYDESDANYLHRRWEEMGWSYWYEHSMQGHQLVIADSTTVADSIEGGASIAWHHVGGSNRIDKISHWKPRRKVVSGKVAHASFDFKSPRPQQASNTSMLKQGKIHQFEVYQYQGLYGFTGGWGGNTTSRVHMEQLSCDAQLYLAEGNCRKIQPGRWFSLKKQGLEHIATIDEDETEFFILGVTHEVSNNFLNSQGGEASYSNSVRCIPRKTLWRPMQGFNSRAVVMPGIDTAIVVGPSGENIHTDQYGRIKVQFHWDREGGNDEKSSAWLRVASNWAGGELGALAVPRIGQEVIVQWLSGSPDRPLVTGSTYNEQNMPPWKLPSQQSLMGIRSRELKPASGNKGLGRSNHLILDDTFEKIQAQLKSDHQCSQLSLGHITRIENNSGRKDFRGEGWELATNAWGVARAGRGMLITTEARNNAAAHTKDMGETVARLQHAHALHEQHAKYAQELGVQEAKRHQESVAKSLAEQHVALAGGGANAELASPHLVLSSPAGIETTTEKSTHIASEDHTAITTGKNFSIASGDSMFATIRKTLRLLVQKAGMKIVAAAGDIDIKALENSINVLAKLNITHTANRITLTAKEEIVINGGGSYIKYSTKGIEQGTKGGYVAHAATHSFVGPNSIPVKIPPPPVANIPDEFSNRLDVHDLFLKHEFEAIGFAAKFADGRAFTGTLDEHGRTSQIYGKEEEAVEVLVGKSHDEWDMIVDEIEMQADAAAEGAIEGGKDAVEAAVGDAILTQSTDPLQALPQRVKDQAIAGAMANVDPRLAGAVGAVMQGQDPLASIARNLEATIVNRALSGVNPHIAGAVSAAILSDSSDPLQALARGIENQVVGEVTKQVGEAVSNAAEKIKKDIFE